MLGLVVSRPLSIYEQNSWSVSTGNNRGKFFAWLRIELLWPVAWVNFESCDGRMSKPPVPTGHSVYRYSAYLTNLVVDGSGYVVPDEIRGRTDRCRCLSSFGGCHEICPSLLTTRSDGKRESAGDRL